MRLAKVVGHVVSTIKDPASNGYKMMVVSFLDDEKSAIVFDAADAGIGDTVLVIADGGASNMILEDNEVIVDMTIGGVVDHYTLSKSD